MMLPVICLMGPKPMDMTTFLAIKHVEVTSIFPFKLVGNVFVEMLTQHNLNTSKHWIVNMEVKGA